LREIKKIVKDRCNDTDRQNIVAKMSREKLINTTSRNEFVSLGKRSYIKCYSRKEGCEIA
jgi:hypothetical protein